MFINSQCELITCKVLSVVIKKLNHSLTVWIPYTSLRSERERYVRKQNGTWKPQFPKSC